MALKLFRTTGYSTLLMPGEARLAPHPARLVLWGCLWLAVACNVGLWRVLTGTGGDWRLALESIFLIGGASGILLSLLAWRRTIKPALTLASVAGALLAIGLWAQQLPIASLWQEPPRVLLPAWPTFMRWQPLTVMLVLAVIPIVWVWNTPVRRLSGPAQLRTNLLGACLAAAVLAAGLLIPA